MITGKAIKAAGEARICAECRYGWHNDRRKGWTYSIYVPSPPPAPPAEEWTCADPSWSTESGLFFEPDNIVMCPVTGKLQWPKCAERNKDGDCALFKKHEEPKPKPEPDKPKRWWRRG